MNFNFKTMERNCMYINKDGNCWAIKQACDPSHVHCDFRPKEIPVVDIKHGGWKPEHSYMADIYKISTLDMPDGSQSYWIGNKRVVISNDSKKYI